MIPMLGGYLSASGGELSGTLFAGIVIGATAAFLLLAWLALRDWRKQK